MSKLNKDVDLSTKEGQQQALTDYFWYLQNCVFNRVKSNPNADDLANELSQDAYLKAHQSIERGKGPSSTIKGWLDRVAFSVVTDHFKRASKNSKINGAPYDLANSYGDIPDNGSGYDHVRDFVDAQRLAALGGLIDNLPTAQKRVMQLYVAQPELSGKEAARILGVKVSAYKMAKQRALENLKKAPLEINYEM